jgi:pimeloyl-ACP methyl ester carboxylesterase
VRLFGGAIVGLPLLPPALASQMALFATNPTAIAETTHEGLNRTADDAALAAATLGSMPLVVIAAGKKMSEPDWAAAQTALSNLSTVGQLIVAEDSGHAVHLERPAIVVDAINRVIDAIRRED